MPADGPSAQTLRRLMKEYESIKLEGASSSNGQSPASSSYSSTSTWNPDVLELRPWDTDGEDLFEWYALIKGPQGGSYADGHFELSIQLPLTYPSNPPKMTFKTKIFHPNVSWNTGEICLDLLSATSWSPAWRLQSCLTAVLALLEDPEPDSPLNVDAAAVYRTEDRVAYRGMCRMYTQLYATGTGVGAGDG